MCPSAPLSEPHTIDNHADESEMSTDLQSMMQGAPNPTNVQTDVDPCKFPPWNFPHDCESLEGGKTDWVICKDTVDRKLLGSSSSYKVFACTGVSHPREDQLAVVDNPDVDLPRAIWLSLQPAENNHNSHQSSNIVQLQVLGRNQDEPSNMPGSNVLNLVPHNAVQHLNEAYHFSTGDYLEDNDLVLTSSSSSSANTSFTFRNSEECFNPEALLLQLETPDTPDANSEFFDPEALLGELETTATPANSESFDPGALLCAPETAATPDANLEYFDPTALLRELGTPATSDTNPEYFDPVALLRELGAPATPGANPVHFDSGAQLRQLETPANTDPNPRNMDCKFSVAVSGGSNRFLIEPPASGSVGSNRRRSIPQPLVEDLEVSAPRMSVRMGSLNRTQSAAAERLPDRVASTHGSAASEASQGPSSSQGARLDRKRKAVSIFAKLKKKFCCFMPF